LDMTGIVNSTGARSGVIGTTVGTPVTDLSTATFPAGHVIQTSLVTGAATSTNLSTTNNDWTGTVVTASIEPLYSDSAIIIYASFGSLAGDTGSDMGYGFRFKRSASGISDAWPESISGYNSGNTHSQFYRHDIQYTTLFDWFNLTLMDSNVTVASTAVTYQLEGAQYNCSGTVSVGGPHSSRWSIWFQEIKR